MRPLRLVALALLLATPAGAQDTPQTTIVQVAPSVADELARSYAPTREQLWQVTAWDSTAKEGYTLLTVRAVQRIAAGSAHHMPAEEVVRLGDLPLIHSHSPGNCQASPADKVTSALRGRAFDGILCGDRYYTWYFAADIVALGNYRTITQQLSNRQD